MTDPGVIVPRCRVLQGLIVQIPMRDFRGTGLLENSRGATRFDAPPGMHTHGRRAAINALSESIDILAVSVGLQQRAEILRELAPRVRRGQTSGSAGLAGSGELDPIGWESVTHQLDPGAVGGVIIIEHGE
jgi:hypothetical protein